MSDISFYECFKKVSPGMVSSHHFRWLDSGRGYNLRSVLLCYIKDAKLYSHIVVPAPFAGICGLGREHEATYARTLEIDVRKMPESFVYGLAQVSLQEPLKKQVSIETFMYPADHVTYMYGLHRHKLVHAGGQHDGWGGIKLTPYWYIMYTDDYSETNPILLNELARTLNEHQD